MRRVLMITHSQVNRDARVTRAAAALQCGGYTVHLLSLVNPFERSGPAGLEGIIRHDVLNLSAIKQSVCNRRVEALKSGDSVSRRIRLAIRHRIFQALSFGPIRYLYFLASAALCSLRVRPDIVHCHDLNVLLIGIFSKVFIRCRIVYDSHEIFVEKVAAQKFRRFWVWLERLLVAHTDRIITTTELRAKLLRNRYPRAPNPEVIHNYPITFGGNPRDLRALANIPQGHIIALYQGGIQIHRGLEVLIQAVEYLENVYIVIQGDGPLFEKVQKLASGSPKRDFIRVLAGGSFDDLRSYTASADIGIQILQPVSVNHTSTISNKLIEYAHAGLPVVASDFPMIHAVIERYPFGLLVDPRDPRQVASAIKKLAESKSLRETLSSRAKEASKELTWETEAVQLLSIYRNLASA